MSMCVCRIVSNLYIDAAAGSAASFVHNNLYIYCIIPFPSCVYILYITGWCKSSQTRLPPLLLLLLSFFVYVREWTLNVRTCVHTNTFMQNEIIWLWILLPSSTQYPDESFLLGCWVPMCQQIQIFKNRIQTFSLLKCKRWTEREAERARWR